MTKGKQKKAPAPPAPGPGPTEPDGCPHVKEVNAKKFAQQVPHAEPECEGCDNSPDESGLSICLKCCEVLCDAKHVVEHCSRKNHTISLSLKPQRAFYCHACKCEPPGTAQLTACAQSAAKAFPLASGPATAAAVQARSYFVKHDAPPPVRGLRNLGNTCYFNSVLQCLARTMPLRTRLAAVAEQRPVNVTLLSQDPPLPALTVTVEAPLGPLTRAFLAFLADMDATATGAVFSPSDLLAQISRMYAKFRGFRQQDSHELLRALLDGLDYEEKLRIRAGVLRAHGLSGDGAQLGSPAFKGLPESTQTAIYAYLRSVETYVDAVFGGRLASTVVCDECHTASRATEAFLDLSLPLSAATKGSAASLRSTKAVKQAAQSAQPLSRKEQRKKDKADKKAKAGGKKGRFAALDSDGDEGDPDPAAQTAAAPDSKSTSSQPNAAPAASTSAPPALPTPEPAAPQGAAAATSSLSLEDYAAQLVRSVLLHVLPGVPLAASATPNPLPASTSPAPTTTDAKTSNSESSKETSAAISSMPVPTGTAAPFYTPKPGECSALSCLSHFCQEERLTGNNMYACGECTRRSRHKSSSCSSSASQSHKAATSDGSDHDDDGAGDGESAKESAASKADKAIPPVLRPASKQMLIQRIPQILTLHFKRFEQSHYALRKTDTHVSFPLVLDVASVCCSSCAMSVFAEGETGVRFGLYGVVVHSGGMGGGHYVCRVRAGLHSSDWVGISDSSVCKMTEAEVLASQAYLLFYERLH